MQPQSNASTPQPIASNHLSLKEQYFNFKPPQFHGTVLLTSNHLSPTQQYFNFKPPQFHGTVLNFKPPQSHATVL